MWISQRVILCFVFTLSVSGCRTGASGNDSATVSSPGQTNDPVAVDRVGFFSGHLQEQSAEVQSPCWVKVKDVEHRFGIKKMDLETSLYPGTHTINCTNHIEEGRRCDTELQDGRKMKLNYSVAFFNAEHTDYRLPSLEISNDNRIESACIDLVLRADQEE